MYQYIVKRLLLAIPTLVGAAALVFLLMRLIPGDICVVRMGSGGAHVVVRDGAGKVVFNGDLTFGDSQTVKASPPVVVQSSNGGLEVTVDGQDRGPLGADGRPASNTFAAAE